MAFIKAYHAFRFREFLNLLTNNKYIIIFNKRERSGVFFTTSLLVVQWAILSIAIWRILSFFSYRNLFLCHCSAVYSDGRCGAFHLAQNSFSAIGELCAGYG